MKEQLKREKKNNNKQRKSGKQIYKRKNKNDLYIEHILNI